MPAVVDHISPFTIPRDKGFSPAIPMLLIVILYRDLLLYLDAHRGEHVTSGHERGKEIVELMFSILTY